MKVLVVATRQIGDVLLTTPLLRAARARWPEARIDLLGLQGQLGMLAGNPDIDHCIETPQRMRLPDAWRLARRFWRRYDLALVTEPGDRAHLLGWIAAPRRHGLLPPNNASNWWKRRLLAHTVPLAGDLGSTHVVREKLALLAPGTCGGASAEPGPPGSPEAVPADPAAGAGQAEDAAPVRVVPPAGRPLPADLLAQLRPGFLVVHAPSMWAYKQWPLAAYSEVVRALLAQGHQLVLTGSGSARDRACLERLRPLGAAPSLIDAGGRLDFPQLRTLLERSRLYLGPDTSVTHLAAACGTPTVALFGPTNPERWAPWPARAGAPVRIQRARPAQQLGNVLLLQGTQACVPCGKSGCEDHRDSRSDCLAAITPVQVLEAVARQLAGAPPPPHPPGPTA